MENQFLVIPNNWQDWVTVFGYVGFTTFIIWRVFTTNSQ
jgi:hypothetical protein